MPWTDNYIGIPHARRGRALSLEDAQAYGVDCWGLVMLVHWIERGAKIPDCGLDLGNTVREAILKAREMMVDPAWGFTPWGEGEPTEFDIVLMETALPLASPTPEPLHVGVYDGAGRILHVQPPLDRSVMGGPVARPQLGAALLDVTDPKAEKRILGFGRWQGTPE